MKRGLLWSLLLTAAGAAWADAGIAVNQVGYLPGATKVAAAPAAPAMKAAGFQVVDARSGRVVLRGRLGAPALWAPACSEVRLMDFSALTRPGQYRIRVAGLPDSPTFTVAPDAYAALNAAAIKAFYFNRASTPLLPEHAGRWARAAGHPDDEVRVHASAAGPGRPEGTVIRAPKGWYDAGDYNKYIVNSGITVYTLAAWEHFPEVFKAQRLNVPESGNGLPDLIDEVLWNLEWMLDMQDPADGGVYHKLTNQGFDGVVMPADARGERYVVQKSTAATLDHGAGQPRVLRLRSPAARAVAAHARRRPPGLDLGAAASRRDLSPAAGHPHRRVRRQPTG